MKAGIHNSV